MIRLAIALLVICGGARAQEASPVAVAMDEARRALDEGDLVTANGALDRAFAASPIGQSDLRSLIELRALLAYADDRLGLLEESLFALAVLTADEHAPESFPPPLRARYEEIAASHPVLELRAELVPTVREGRRTVRVVPIAASDRGRLVRSFVVRAAIGSEALEVALPTTELDAGDPHQRALVRYAIEARGPGGALIATLGTERDPRALALDALPVDQTGFHVALVTAASVLAAAAIAFGFAWLATDGFTAGQPTAIAPPSCTGDPCAAHGALVEF